MKKNNNLKMKIIKTRKIIQKNNKTNKIVSKILITKK